MPGSPHRFGLQGGFSDQPHPAWVDDSPTHTHGLEQASRPQRLEAALDHHPRILLPPEEPTQASLRSSKKWLALSRLPAGRRQR